MVQMSSELFSESENVPIDNRGAAVLSSNYGSAPQATVIDARSVNGNFDMFWPCHLTSVFRPLNYGLFAPKTIRCRERKFHTWNFRSLVLSKRMEDGAKVRNRERKLTIC